MWTAKDDALPFLPSAGPIALTLLQRVVVSARLSYLMLSLATFPQRSVGCGQESLLLLSVP